MPRAHDKTKTKYQALLLDHFDGNTTQASAAIGIHSSTLSRNLSTGESTHKVEDMARRAWEKIEKAPLPSAEPSQNMFLALVPEGKFGSFKKVADLMGVELVEV